MNPGLQPIIDRLQVVIRGQHWIDWRPTRPEAQGIVDALQRLQEIVTQAPPPAPPMSPSSWHVAIRPESETHVVVSMTQDHANYLLACRIDRYRLEIEPMMWALNDKTISGYISALTLARDYIRIHEAAQ